MNPSRIDWVDRLKGIGITLVVLGHFGLPPLVHRYVFAFHMPLFFFVSGLLYDARKYHTLGSFLRQRWHTLLIPYFCFSALLYLYWLLGPRLVGDPENLTIPAWKPLLGILYGNGFGTWMRHAVPLWFLPCLFVTEVCYFLLQRQTNPPRRLGALVLLGLVGWLDSLYMPIRLPWGFDVALVAVVF